MIISNGRFTNMNSSYSSLNYGGVTLEAQSPDRITVPEGSNQNSF